MKKVLRSLTAVVLSLGMMSTATVSSFAAGSPSVVHTHSAKDGSEKVVTVATCTTKGVKSYVCKDCGKTYEVVGAIDANNHSSDAGTVVNGLKTYKCTRCSAVLKTETVMTTGSNYTTTTGATVTVLSATTTSIKVKNVTTKGVSVPSSVVVNGVTYKVTTVKGDAFNGNVVTSVTIPSSVTKLNAKTFSGDKKLTTIKINSKKLTVGKNLFSGISAKKKAKIKVTVNKKNMSAKNFYNLRKELMKQGLKYKNIKRK